jgi:hypothetical protein
MKKPISFLLLMAAVFMFQPVSAQVRVGININIGDQPRWRPAGYDYVEYYYLPDIESYYYVPTHQFIYLSNGRWVFSASLPNRYRSYNLYTGTKIVINRTNAYHYYPEHRMKYGTRKIRSDNGRHNGWYKKQKRRH